MADKIASNLFGWWEWYKLHGVQASYERLLEDLRAAGVTAVEPINPGLEELVVYRKAGLHVPSCYVGADFHSAWNELQVEERLLPLAHALAEAGGSVLTVNADPKGGWGVKLVKTEDELKRQGENLSRLAEVVQPLGLQIAFHNHGETREHTEGDLRSVIDYADASVGLCIDTAWSYISGIDVLTWIAAYPERIRGCHLRNQRGVVPTEDLLEGEIPMASVLQALKDIQYAGWWTLELWHQQATAAQRTIIEDTVRSLQLIEMYS